MNKVRSILRIWGVITSLLMIVASVAFGQTTGDYRSSTAGNWSTRTNWQRWSGTAWATPTAGQGYPGQFSANAAVTIQNNISMTLDVSPANSLGSLILASGNNATSLTFNGTRTLTVSGDISMGSGTGNGDHRTITIGTGVLNAGSVTMTETNNNNRDDIISITTGTLTISGDLTMPASFARNHIDVSGAATITIGGNVSNGSGGSGGGFTTPPAGSTINLNGSSAQTVFLDGGGSSLGNFQINNAMGVTNGAAISVAGNLIVNGTLGGATTVTLTGASTAIDGVGTISSPLSITSNSSVSTTANLIWSSSVSINNGVTVTNNGSITASDLGTTGNWTQGLNAILNFSGTAIGPVLDAGATGNTVNYSATGQTLSIAPYYHLTLSGGAESFGAISTINGDLTLSGTASATTGGALTIGGNLTIGSGTSFATGAGAGWTLSVGGATSVSGTLTLDNTNTKTFTGNVTLNAGGVWNETAAATINYAANLQNDGTSYTANSGTHIFSGSGKTLSGSVSLSISDMSVTGTYMNNGTLTVGNSLAGSGSLTNGASASLTLGGSVTISTLTASAAGNTVYYNSSTSGQGVQGNTTYYNLNLSNGTSKQVQSGSITVLNILTINSVVFQIGNYNLILSNTSTGALAGSSFSISNMIQTNGTGYVQKAGGSGGSGLNMVYPIGVGGYYDPLTITGFSATGTGTLQIGATTASLGATYLSKYWTLNVAGYAGITTSLRFNYNSGEVNGKQSKYDTYYNNGSSWGTAPGTHTSLGANPFGTDVSGVSASSISGQWSAGQIPIAYYSYQSGNWSDTTTWTTDPSGTQWVNPGVPSLPDQVTILNGRTISILTNGKQINSLTLNQGSILDLKATTGHNFGTVSGQGKMMLNSNTFPGGSVTNFVASGGGTIEYYNLNNVSFSTTQLTYNNLVISNYTGSSYSTFFDAVSNPTTYTINGNLSIKNFSSGTESVYFGNTVPSDNLISMNVYGDVSVDAGCTVGVNNFASSHAIPDPTNNTTPYPVHTLTMYGNFTNNGTVRLTGLPSPMNNAYYLLTGTAYGGTNYGDVQVYFKGATNNAAVCNGITDFFRIVIEKGSDKTYVLEVSSSNVSNFGLYGPNNQGSNTFDAGPEGYGYGAYYKALFIHYGTIKLDANISIPSLTEGGQDFNVIPTAGLWIDGATVSTTLSGVNGTGYQAMTLYGLLRISSGQFSSGDAAGLVLGILGTPIIMIEGGTFTVSQAWNASGGSNQMSYIQSGGTANFQLGGENHAGPMFNLSNINSVFVMSGGTMNFTNNTFSGGGTDFQIMDVECQPGNYSVTGGTVNFALPSSATTYTTSSTVPFYNLNISRGSGTGTVLVQWNTPGTTLTVVNDVTIGANSTLNMATSSIDLLVGHNFTIASGGTYSPATGAANTTTFNGTGAQLFNNIGTITGNALNNVTLSNTSVTSIISNDVTINKSLTIGPSAVLNDSGRYVFVLGNITNTGTHRGLLTGGGIRMTGTTAQTIDGGGTGTFGNLIIDKPNTTGVSLIGNASLTGNLRLVTNANFYLGSRSLSLGANSNIYTNLTTTAASFDNTHMVYTSGLPSDGGLSKTFDNSHTTFVYPIGTGTSYRPAKIQFTANPLQYGSISIRPILAAHPLVQAAGKSITLYWKTVSAGFSGIQSNSINQTYYFVTADVPTATDTVNYIPGTYIAPNWISINNTGAVYNALNPREIHFDAVNYIDGEYTTGTSAAFAGLTTYYSNSNNASVTSSTGADWNAANTWCTGSNTGTPVAALADNKATASFIIGDGSATVHKINVTGTHQITSGNVTIQSDGILDIGTSSGHNFGPIISSPSGNGILRIASNNYFPRGDWGDFLGTSGGTVEFYQTTSGTLTLPTSYLLPSGSSATITGYYNLNMLPYNASNIILPNTDLVVKNNLTVGYSAGSGTANCITQINPQTTTRTLEVQGNIVINQYGILQFMNGAAQNIIADRNITVANGGSLQVRNGGTSVANALTVYGSITNNGTFDMDANYPTNDNYRCSLTFTGNSNKLLTSTTSPTRTRLYNINTNIGSTRDSVLNVNISSTGFQMGGGGLTLQNGTFRLTTNVVMNLSAGTFTIPSTTCLSANGGTFNIVTGASSGDLMLNGRLEVLSGAINVGPAVSSASANSFNIIYASASTPEIVVSGGTLSVFTQIRRPSGVTSGGLSYTQSGGTVTIGGKNADATRAGLEILNSGSKFIMSNGTIILANHISNSVPFDLDIEAAASSVTGGTIQFGLASVTANQTVFYFQSANTLNNLVLESTTNARAIQQIQPLHLMGNLTIGGTSGYYNANNLDVYIGGTLTNNNTTAASNGVNVGGYQTQSLSQNTIFNGVADQAITGSGSNRTNFANLEIAPSSGYTVTLSGGTSSIAVNGNLTLTSGTLNDGGKTIYLLQNVTNNAVHSSSNPTSGGMIFTGSANQVIGGSGTGIFGNIEINNGGNGVNMVKNTTINGQIKFTNGYFYINDFALTLGSAATIAGTVNVSNMIVLNGASSDKGVIKIFPSGASSFTFPVGNNGKYTPATFAFSANSNSGGAIKVIPVNSVHPSVNPSNYSNYLNYYWTVSTTGFASSYAVTQSYTYSNSDVQGSPANIERFNNSTSQWSTVSGSISSPIFSFSSSSILDGSYTIGDVFNDLRIFTSKQSGNWNDPNTWDTLAVPNGNPVIIRSQDSVALSANGAFASSVKIYGVLDAVNTTFHSLGEVSGSGKIKILNTGDGMFVFPAGSYDSLFLNPASTVEFYGNTNGTLPLDVGSVTKPYQQVIFSGTGIKYISSVDMKVLGNMTFRSGSKLDNSLYNKDVYLIGNWVDGNTSVGGFTPGTGTVRFSGASLQYLTMANNSVTETFYNLAINNAAGMTIQTGKAAVSNQLLLTLGNINTNATNTLTITNTSTSAVVGGSVNSFVNGPLSKKINNGSNFKFPVGDAVSSSRNRFGYASVTATVTSGTQTWTAQFFDKNPTTDGYDVSQMSAPLSWLNSNEYWNIIGPSGGSANVVLSWDSYTGMSSSATTRAQTDVAEWGTPVASKWNAVGQMVSDYGRDSGTVATSISVGLDNHIFTIGSGIVPVGSLLWAIQTGLWNTASTWSSGYVPGPNDTVAIGTPYPSAVVTMDVNPTIISLSLNANGTVADAAHTLTLSGNITLNGTWNGSGGSINWTTDNDTLSGSGTVTGTMTVLAAGNKVVRTGASPTLYDVTIAAAKSLTNYGTLTVHTMSGAAGTSSFVNTANSVLNVTGALLSTGTLNASSGPNTVAYAGSGAQTILPASYSNLILSNGNTKSASGAITINKNLTVSSGTIFNDGGYTHSLYGNFIFNGKWSGSGIVQWNPNSTDTLSGSGGVATGTSTLSITANNKVITVSNDTLYRIEIPAAYSVTNKGSIRLTRLIGGIGGATWINSTGSSLSVSDSLLPVGTLTATAVSNSIIYDGTAAQSIKNANYNNLFVSGSRGPNSITWPSSTVGISGSFSAGAVFSGGNYITTANTIDFNGTGAQSIPAFPYNNLTISGARGGATVTLVSGDTIKVAGTLSATATGVNYTTTNNWIDFNGSGTQSIPAFQYNNLRISGARGGATVTMVNGDTIKVSGIFSPVATSLNYVTANNWFNFNGTGAQTVPAFNYNSLKVTGARTVNNVTFVNGGTIGIASVFTDSATFTSGSYITTANTVSFNGSGAQSIPAFKYYNLQTASGGVKTVAASMKISGNFTIGTSTTVAAGSTIDTLYGDWTNNGTFSPGTSTIILASASNAVLSGSTTFNTLVVAKNSSATTITLNNNMTAANVTMNTGLMLTGSNAITITSTRTGSGFILGTITRTHTFTAGTPYAFEGPYNTLTFNAGGTLPTSVTVFVDTVSPGANTYMEPVNRYYTISQSGGSGFTYTMRLHYNGSEVLSPNYKSSLKIWQRTSTGPDVWFRWGATTLDSVNFWVEQTGINVTGTWSLSSRTVPNIVLNMSANLSNPVPGDTVIYTITYSNTGDGNATNTIITAGTPLHMSYASNSVTVNSAGKTDSGLDSDGVTVNSGNISVNLSTIVGTIGPGANGTVTYKVIVN